MWTWSLRNQRLTWVDNDLCVTPDSRCWVKWTLILKVCCVFNRGLISSSVVKWDCVQRGGKKNPDSFSDLQKPQAPQLITEVELKRKLTQSHAQTAQIQSSPVLTCCSFPHFLLLKWWMVIPTLVPTTCGWNLLWKAANQKAGWFKVCPEVQYKINKDCFKQKITGSYSGVQQQNLWSWKWAFKCLCMHICSHALHHHDHHFISKALKNNISAVEKNERSSVKHWISYKFIHKCQIWNSTTLKSELCALVCFSGTISPTSQVHGEVIRLPDQRVSASSWPRWRPQADRVVKIVQQRFCNGCRREREAE